MAIPNEKEKYSYADYLTWNEGERLELIDGKIFNMSPIPSRRHQQVLRELSTAFSVFLREKDCEVFFAPFDVRLLADNKRDDDINNVVQPDLSIVCDKEKLDDKGCKGAPDMIIEILSPSSVKLDRWKKYQLYEKAGVHEYWIVDPINNSVEIHLLIDAQYKFQGVFTKDDTISVNLFPDFKLDLNRIFAKITLI
ncbi:Uma2 family endonuclease [Heyndrickxia sporothermodurans]|nr:Uma2 family endonuclease [Heyndrickxia sporothermodurans]MEB6549793.1 Uma2 family endonuclease [Heyndrickxia sporothermodurans]MED3652449.1 Uma2 family endonuclease [Heyndrickxia sporothermodurans]MED3696800.1 Uma2 family endonuclease [Heyndrickxia sporothermodurans]MED3780657.1 Uma2 family endonuclease [Heyndrickxia sporothermodurans]